MKVRNLEKSFVLSVFLVAIWVISTGSYAAQEAKPAKPASVPSNEASTQAGVPAKTPNNLESLSATEFSRLSRDFSDEGGYFRSDNFTSNETAYLTVVDKLRELGASGGAYIGVGPEQ